LSLGKEQCAKKLKKEEQGRASAYSMKQKVIVLILITILVMGTLVGTALAATPDTISVTVNSDGRGSLIRSQKN